MHNILIIEDELLASKRLIKILKEIAPDFNRIDTCDSIKSSIDFLKTNPQPHLIFLDIHLSDGDSFEIFKEVNVDCPIIFTTAYNEHVFKAFEFNSIDYLLKPIDKNALAKSLNKFHKLNQSNSINWEKINSIFNNKPNYKERFLVNVGSNLISIESIDIAYFYSVNGSCFIVNKSGNTFSIEYSLDKIEAIVEPNIFFRINRQYIIARDSIKKISLLSKSRIKVILKPSREAEDLYVSTARAHEFRCWLD